MQSTILLIAAGLPAACYLSFPYFWRWICNRSLVETTCILELPLLEEVRPENKKIPGTVIICGGSIAGLLTARVCHNHFQHIVIVEPEAWLATEEGYKAEAWTQKHQRSRVMQYYSAQVLQPFFLKALKALFPKVEEECNASDIAIIPADFSAAIWGHPTRIPLAEYNGNLPKNMYCSRQGLETFLRRLVLGKGCYQNIEWMVGTVIAMEADSTNPSRVKKVSIRAASGTKELEAVLVVDCTGPARSGVKMLERTGYGFAKSYPQGTLPLDELKVTYDQQVRYSTFHFTITPDLRKRLPIPGGFENVAPIYILLTDPTKNRRILNATKVDGKRLHVCFGAWGDNDLPRSLPEGKEYINSLVLETPIPDWFVEMFDMLGEVEDTMTVHHAHVPPTSYSQYHKGVNLPSNWIAIGDSVMRVNPIFGEGCSKAMVGAITMNTLLRRLVAQDEAGLPTDFASRFFKLQQSKIEGFWQSTKNYDYNFETTVPLPGETLATGAVLRWYFRRFLVLARTDDEACSAFWHSISLLGPGIEVLKPSIVIKVLWNSLVNSTFKHAVSGDQHSFKRHHFSRDCDTHY